MLGKVRTGYVRLVDVRSSQDISVQVMSDYVRLGIVSSA
jgi:hypothetical protein